MTRSEFAARIPVSRETLDRLAAYVALLEKWNRRINLVGPSTLADAWSRHILDSAQLWPLLPKDARVLVDVGTGAGLPGLILAILGVPEVHLVESDARKAAFLGEAARATGALVKIHIGRIESVPAVAADIVVSRALAPLPRLLEYAARFLGPGASCYFHKGSQWAEEVAAARPEWSFDAVPHPSLSNSAGVILQLERIGRDSRQ